MTFDKPPMADQSAARRFVIIHSIRPTSSAAKNPASALPRHQVARKKSGMIFITAFTIAEPSDDLHSGWRAAFMSEVVLALWKPKALVMFVS
jgi:hypothetical protein